MATPVWAQQLSNPSIQAYLEAVESYCENTIQNLPISHTQAAGNIIKVSSSQKQQGSAVWQIEAQIPVESPPMDVMEFIWGFVDTQKDWVFGLEDITSVVVDPDTRLCREVYRFFRLLPVEQNVLRGRRRHGETEFVYFCSQSENNRFDSPFVPFNTWFFFVQPRLNGSTIRFFWEVSVASVPLVLIPQGYRFFFQCLANVQLNRFLRSFIHHKWSGIVEGLPGARKTCAHAKLSEYAVPLLVDSATCALNGKGVEVVLANLQEEEEAEATYMKLTTLLVTIHTTTTNNRVPAAPASKGNKRKGRGDGPESWHLGTSASGSPMAPAFQQPHVSYSSTSAAAIASNPAPPYSIARTASVPRALPSYNALMVASPPQPLPSHPYASDDPRHNSRSPASVTADMRSASSAPGGLGLGRSGVAMSPNMHYGTAGGVNPATPSATAASSPVLDASIHHHHPGLPLPPPSTPSTAALVRLNAPQPLSVPSPLNCVPQTPPSGASGGPMPSHSLPMAPPAAAAPQRGALRANGSGGMAGMQAHMPAGGPPMASPMRGGLLAHQTAPLASPPQHAPNPSPDSSHASLGRSAPVGPMLHRVLAFIGSTAMLRSSPRKPASQHPPGTPSAATTAAQLAAGDGYYAFSPALASGACTPNVQATPSASAPSTPAIPPSFTPIRHSQQHSAPLPSASPAAPGVQRNMSLPLSFASLSPRLNSSPAASPALPVSASSPRCVPPIFMHRETNPLSVPVASPSACLDLPHDPAAASQAPHILAMAPSPTFSASFPLAGLDQSSPNAGPATPHTPTNAPNSLAPSSPRQSQPNDLLLSGHVGAQSSLSSDFYLPMSSFSSPQLALPNLQSPAQSAPSSPLQFL